MNDNRRRSQQWQRLVGAFFAPILGSTPEAWAEGNRAVSASLFEPDSWRRRLRAAPDYAAFERVYLLDWLGQMCRLVGVPMPPEEESLELARRADDSIPRRVNAAFPGATEAIRTLHARGYPLCTASGESSVELAGYLDGMGVRECFGRLYGSDLIDAFKAGPEFYERIFADATVAPSDAVVVDDSPEALGWAAQTGARTVLVDSRPHPDAWRVPSGCLRIGSLVELPLILERLNPHSS